MRWKSGVGIVLAAALAHACVLGAHDGYSNSGGQIVWGEAHGDANIIPPFATLTPVFGADAATFVAIPGSPPEYGMDKNYVYFRQHRLPGADLKSFRLIERRFDMSRYSRDKDHVFYREHLLPGADPGTFKPLGAGYSADATHVYYDETPLDGANAATFKVNGLFSGTDGVSQWHRATKSKEGPDGE
jgi:hypothetical protein